MMTAPRTKAELAAHLDETGNSISATIAALTRQDFERASSDEWSASGYLQHLILSVKPLAKALALPPAQMHKLFGQPDHESRSYADIVAFYQARIAQLLPPGSTNPLEPTTYRFPEGTTDQKAYLAQTWAEAQQRLLQALAGWEEADLDAYQLPHPAMGPVTLREMLMFTYFHMTLHWHDMQRVSARE
ncbi:MAG: DinB family protein [Chloroflexi bacterium]|nr:DinB family protein [Chloroflexota bacterium]